MPNMFYYIKEAVKKNVFKLNHIGKVIGHIFEFLSYISY